MVKGWKVAIDPKLVCREVIFIRDIPSYNTNHKKEAKRKKRQGEGFQARAEKKKPLKNAKEKN